VHSGKGGKGWEKKEENVTVDEEQEDAFLHVEIRI